MIKDNNYNLNIIGPIGIKNKVFELFNAYNFETEEEINKYINLNILEISDKSINILEYKISPYKVLHGKQKSCLGYVINDKLGLTGDASICDGVEMIFNKSNLVICDTSFLIGDKSHLGVGNIEYLISKYNTKVIATHLRDITRKTLLENKLANIKVVEDFYELNL